MATSFLWDFLFEQVVLRLESQANVSVMRRDACQPLLDNAFSTVPERPSAAKSYPEILDVGTNLTMYLVVGAATRRRCLTWRPIL